MKIILTLESIESNKNTRDEILWMKEFMNETGFSFKQAKTVANIFSNNTDNFKLSKKHVLNIDDLYTSDNFVESEVDHFIKVGKQNRTVSYKIIAEEDYSLQEIFSGFTITPERIQEMVIGTYKPSEEEIKLMAQYIKAVQEQKPVAYMSEGAHGILGEGKDEVPVRAKPFYNDEQPLFKAPIIILKSS